MAVKTWYCSEGPAHSFPKQRVAASKPSEMKFIFEGSFLMAVDPPNPNGCLSLSAAPQSGTPTDCDNLSAYTRGVFCIDFVTAYGPTLLHRFRMVRV